MTAIAKLTRILIAASAAMPILAQTPLFNDGTAFGGSLVFSDGINPLGNPARSAQAQTGFYLSYLDGDQRAKDNKSILGSAASMTPPDPGAIAKLNDAPWALRTRAYGLAATKQDLSAGQGSTLAFTREQMNGMMAYGDTNSTANSFLDGRRAVVNRLSLAGSGAADSGMTFGGTLRIERWDLGQQLAVQGVPGPGQVPFSAAEDNLLSFSGTSDRALVYGLDFGAVFTLSQGVLLGAMVEQINHRHLGDVDLKPQFRAGLQIDLGQTSKLILEGDLNSVEKMPLPEKQQSYSASLQMTVNPSTAFRVGVEQRKIAGASINLVGASLRIRMDSLALSIGFQAGQDRPMMGVGVMVN